MEDEEAMGAREHWPKERCCSPGRNEKVNISDVAGI